MRTESDTMSGPETGLATLGTATPCISAPTTGGASFRRGAGPGRLARPAGESGTAKRSSPPVLATAHCRRDRRSRDFRARGSRARGIGVCGGNAVKCRGWDPLRRAGTGRPASRREECNIERTHHSAPPQPHLRPRQPAGDDPEGACVRSRHRHRRPRGRDRAERQGGRAGADDRMVRGQRRVRRRRAGGPGELPSSGDALGAGKRPDRYVALSRNIVHSAQVVLDGQVDRVTNIRILTDSPLEHASDNLADKFDRHPSPHVLDGVYVLRHGPRANGGHDAQQILMALRHSNETADLPHAVRLSVMTGFPSATMRL